MGGLRVKLFGSASVAMHGQPVKLKPITMTVLIRLIVADGAPVTVDELFKDCWPPADLIVGDYRTQVQKRIHEIRRVLEPERSSESAQESKVLPTQRGRITAYRWAVSRESTDVFQFIELVAQGRRAADEDRIGLLERAMSLWTGQPLLDVADKPWAARLIRQLSGICLAAERELANAYENADRAYDALDAVEALAAKSPHDGDLASWVSRLRTRVQAGPNKLLVREDFTDLKAGVTVMTGDLFAQDDANLVVGFCDTFDTDIDRNIVISQESTQGVMLRQLYNGDRVRLDKELKSALSRTPKIMVESKSAKRRGKLTRYPVGTVATLHHSTRRVFAVAYSRMGNDLMAQSSLSILQASLENLWDAVYRHGQLKPIAMPLIGSGLSRTGATDEELLATIVRTFAASARRHYLGPELRVVIGQPTFDVIRVSEVLRSARAERGNGQQPDQRPEGEA